MSSLATNRVVVGGDVLDIMTVAMYAEPLVIYRELVQNAADAIERAIKEDLISEGAGCIEINLEGPTRTVVVRDNGYGLPNADFEAQMLALGASAKRGASLRGFRGIGRLAGVGHFREIAFRSRSAGDQSIMEVRWDSLFVQSSLASESVSSLEAIVTGATTFRQYDATSEPDHFFEVSLIGARRLPDDRLFSASRIARYLSQVAPVGFSPDFSYGKKIKAEIQRRIPLLEVRLSVSGNPVYKPYGDKLMVKRDRQATIKSVETIEVPSGDEGLSAFGWVAHTDYLGSLSQESLVRGLRVRSGNIQIGDDAILACVFPEERFNSWAIGEFHVFDGRIRPNARRDAFEPGIAVDDLHNKLAPYGSAIARQCRIESRRRNVTKKAHLLCEQVKALENMLRGRRGALMAFAREALATELRGSIHALQELAEDLSEAARHDLLQADVAARKMLASRRRQKAARLNPRSRGQLDIIVWLFKAGKIDLIEPALRNIKSIESGR